QALARHRELGDRAAECYTLRSLAATYRDAGRTTEAADSAAAARDLARNVGDRRVEAEAVTILANIDGNLFEESLAAHRRALRLAHEIGDRYGEADALAGLATAHFRAGD